MVFDLNKCLGCHTCSIACKQLWTNRNGREYMYWNNVETRPGRGYPRNWEKEGGGFKEGRVQVGRLPSLEDYGIPWEYNYQEVLLEGKGETVEPHVPPTWGTNWDEDEGEGQWPNSYHFYLPRLCNHCTRPACLAACPRNAIYKREEDGIVLVDQERCRGYRYCVQSCPYDKVYFNFKTNKAEKCILCYPRVEKGTVPACSVQCPGRLRFVGWRDDKEGQVYKLVEEWKVALPLHPEFGTEPNIFYIPPLHTTPPPFEEDGSLSVQPRIPLSYLESLFTSKVGEALDTVVQEIEKRRRGQSSALTEILIGYTAKDRFRL